jgi:hypothetical protein
MEIFKAYYDWLTTYEAIKPINRPRDTWSQGKMMMTKFKSKIIVNTPSKEKGIISKVAWITFYARGFNDAYEYVGEYASHHYANDVVVKIKSIEWCDDETF